MRKTLILTLLLIIMTSTQVLATNSSVFSLVDIYEDRIPIEEYDFRPMYDEHHTCGYGGTSCRPCEYYYTYKNYCGCASIHYKCCCGNTIVTDFLPCNSHKR
ncbi:hypothetical protein [Alkaliphilus crotonatoxidans]